MTDQTDHVPVQDPTPEQTPTLWQRVTHATKRTTQRVKEWASANHDGTAPPRILRYTLAGLAALVVAVVYGVIGASADANFGPHDARYEVTVDSAISVDAGPLGSVVLDSPLPLSLGVHATIGEIPDDLTTVEAGSTLQALGQDLEGYLQFFAAPQETLSLVARLLIQSAATRALICAGGLIVFGAFVAYVAGHSRRRELAYRAARATWGLVAGFVVLSLVAAAGFQQAAQRKSESIGGRTSAVFAGTALEGARITGRLSGVIDDYGGKLLDVYNQNEEFYAQANDSLNIAFDARDELENHVTELQERYSDTPPSSKDLVSILFVTDLHCNVGMAPLIETAAKRSGAQIVMNGGDSTINGTDIERFCMEAFAKAVPSGATMVQSDGNHDSDTTGAQARAAGVVVLDGETVDVHGVRFLGDSDPRKTQIGQGSQFTGSESYADAGARLAQQSCRTGEDPDILLIHTPAVGSYTLAQGCVPYQFSGHMHTQDGPKLVGQGIQFVGGSGAGAVEGKPTIGPLNGTAEMTVIRFDRNAREIVDRQLISIDTDGIAKVGPRIAYPTYAALQLEMLNSGSQSAEESETADTEARGEDIEGRVADPEGEGVEGAGVGGEGVEGAGVGGAGAGGDAGTEGTSQGVTTGSRDTSGRSDE